MFFRSQSESVYNKENREMVNKVLRLLQRSCNWEIYDHGKDFSFKHKTNGMILEGTRYSWRKVRVEITLWEDKFLIFSEKSLFKEVEKLKKKLRTRKNGIQKFKRIKRLKELKRVIDNEYYYIEADINPSTKEEKLRMSNQIHEICRGKVHIKRCYGLRTEFYKIWVNNHEDMIELGLTIL